MDYYKNKGICEKFLLLRFVATRFCNYRCPYCYLTEEIRNNKEDLFSYHSLNEWIEAIGKLSNYNLDLYFTGGEPLLVDQFIDLVSKLVLMDNVKYIRIDSNLSPLNKFLKKVDSSKISFLASFHPSHISFTKFMDKLLMLKDKRL